jgi:hypothetical protein
MKMFRRFWRYLVKFFRIGSVKTNAVEKIKTHILCSIIFFSEKRTVYEIMSEKVVVTEEPQMTSQYGAYALHAGLARLYARRRMHTPSRPGTNMHARTCKHAHTEK